MVWKIGIFSTIQILREMNIAKPKSKLSSIIQTAVLQDQHLLDLISRKNMSGRKLLQFSHCVVKTLKTIHQSSTET